jgi:DNA-binding MarR family transcriptional regulator
MQPSKALPIRKRLSALTCIKAGPKAVLIEVCELHENGGRGCFASNDTLSKKLGVSVATITRTIASLITWGLLAGRVVPAEANRRYLSPTAAVRACYAGGTEAEQTATVAKLTIVKNDPETELTIVETGADYSQNDELTIVKSETDYSQNASRVIGEDQKKTNLEAQLKNLREGLAEAEEELLAAQKKIVELEAQLQAEREASRTRGAGTMTGQPGGRWGYDPAAISPALVLPFETDTFRHLWTAYRAYREEKEFPQFTGGMQEQEALRQLAALANGSEEVAEKIIAQAIRKGWKDLYKLDEPRPSTQQPAPGQSGGGQKPTLNAVAMAGTLASRRFNQPGGSAGNTGQTTGTNPGQSPGGAPGFGAN